MDKLKLGLVGAGGRMGKAITQVLSHSPKSKLTSAIVRKGSVFEGLDSGLHSGINSENHIPYTSDLDKEMVKADVWIDFSTQSSFSENLSLFQKHKKPVVIGTTGLTASQKEEIRSACLQIPIVFSPNMSVGVNLLFKLTEIAAKALKDYDIEVLDIHHRHKKDSPSGTTEKLKDVLLRSLQRTEDEVIYGRHGIYPERPNSEIGIHTMRAGEVVGEHTVFFFSPEERIEITHRAQDRKTFAVGSVKAAEFLKNAKPGLYDMFDVLGI